MPRQFDGEVENTVLISLARVPLSLKGRIKSYSWGVVIRLCVAVSYGVSSASF